jgi:hypothetical protein
MVREMIPLHYFLIRSHFFSQFTPESAAHYSFTGSGAYPPPRPRSRRPFSVLDARCRYVPEIAVRRAGAAAIRCRVKADWSITRDMPSPRRLRPDMPIVRRIGPPGGAGGWCAFMSRAGDGIRASHIPAAIITSPDMAAPASGATTGIQL